MAGMGNDDDWQPPTEGEMKVQQARRERSDKISTIMGSYLLKGYAMLATTCRVCGTILLRDRDMQEYCIACQELDTDTSKDDPALSHEAAARMAAEGDTRSSGQSEAEQSEVEGGPLMVRLSRWNHESPAEPEEEFFYAPAAPQPPAPARPGAPSRPGGVPPPGLGCPPLPVRPSSARLITPDVTRHTPGSERGNYPGQVLAIPLTETGGTIDPRREAIAQNAISAVQERLVSATSNLKQATDVRQATELCQLIKASAEALEALHKVRTGQQAS